MTARAARARVRVRRWLRIVRRRWAGSLRFRTTVITVTATALATAIAFIWAALLIHNELFDSRRDEVLIQAERAVQEAQESLENSEFASDRAALRQLMTRAVTDMQQQSGTDLIAYFRIDDSASAIAPPDAAPEVLRTPGLISDGLRERVSETSGQWYQSVALPTGTGEATSPGIIVGTQLTVQNAGTYEVFFGFDLGASEQILRFVQATLWGAGAVLVVLVAFIAWFVLRSVTGPVVEASATSARFASGDFDVRMDVRGEDELARLGRSFNAMADSIEAQITELAELSQVQQRFVSDVSHELRTPLTTIRLASSMLYDERAGFDPTTARAAELLQTQVERFEQLLGDLLEISRYDAGSAQLEVEATGIAALTEDVVESMTHVAAQHETELRFIAPGGHSPVEVDPRRIRRILRNLIGNAIEHGEKKPVVITVDSSSTAVAISVRDFGVGMTDDEAARVFDRFWRADPSRKRTLGGTGLGLAIALGDAQLHQGTLQVWSRPGEGTNFVLTLPRSSTGASLRSLIPVEPARTIADDLAPTQPVRAAEEGPR